MRDFSGFWIFKKKVHSVFYLGKFWKYCRQQILMISWNTGWKFILYRRTWIIDLKYLHFNQQLFVSHEHTANNDIAVLLIINNLYEDVGCMVSSSFISIYVRTFVHDFMTMLMIISYDEQMYLKNSLDIMGKWNNHSVRIWNSLFKGCWHFKFFNLILFINPRQLNCNTFI